MRREEEADGRCLPARLRLSGPRDLVTRQGGEARNRAGQVQRSRNKRDTDRELQESLTGALPWGSGICRSPKQPSPAPRGMLSRTRGRHRQGGLGARLSVRGTPRRRTRGLRSRQTPWHIPAGDTEPEKSPSTAPGASRNWRLSRNPGSTRELRCPHCCPLRRGEGSARSDGCGRKAGKPKLELIRHKLSAAKGISAGKRLLRAWRETARVSVQLRAARRDPQDKARSIRGHTGAQPGGVEAGFEPTQRVQHCKRPDPDLSGEQHIHSSSARQHQRLGTCPQRAAAAVSPCGHLGTRHCTGLQLPPALGLLCSVAHPRGHNLRDPPKPSPKPQGLLLGSRRGPCSLSLSGSPAAAPLHSAA